MKYTVEKLLDVFRKIYSVQDARLYDLEDLMYYHQKWLLRYVSDQKKNKQQLSIEKLMASISWFFGIIDRFNINLQPLLEKRYSFKCPFCMDIPCACGETRNKAKKTGRPVSGNPKTVDGWQAVIRKIYPNKPEFSKLSILLAQDIFHQSFRNFRQSSGKRNMKEIETACADYFVELLKVANNLDIDLTESYLSTYLKGCYVCRKTPCACFYKE